MQPESRGVDPGGGRGQHRGPMSGRILVVDDSPTLRRVVSAMLERGGYTPITANDGEQALDVLRNKEQGPISLVLLDFVMPKLNGLEVGRRMQADPQLKATPVVLMSAKADKIREQFAEQTGAVDAINKPFEPTALMAVVEGALARGREPKTTKSPPRQDAPPRSAPKPQVSSGKPAVDPAELVGLVKAALEHLGEGLWRSNEQIEAAAAAALAGQPPPSQRGEGRPREVLRAQAGAVPLGEVLQVLQMQQQTGVLEVQRDDGIEVRLHMRNGLVDLVSARGAGGEFLVGRYLIEDGHLTRDDLEDALQVSRGHRRLLGDELITRGLITREQLLGALMRQSSELIYEILRWTEARYVFVRDSNFPKGIDAELGLPVASLVMEGFRRVDEWRLIEENIEPSVVLTRDEASLDRMGRSRLSKAEQLVLELVDGQRAAAQIVEQSNMSSFEAYKILYQFLQSRLVRKRAAA